MAKRVKFDYDGEKYEGVAREEDQKRLMLTDVTVTTADGQRVSYRTPLMVDMAKCEILK